MTDWIRVLAEPGPPPVLHADLAPGQLALVNGVTSGWARRLEGPRDPLDWAAAELAAAVARAAQVIDANPPAAASADRAGARVAVTGEGALAVLCRRFLARCPVHPAGTKARIVVDASGTAAGLAAALVGVADCGTVLLLARPHPAAPLLSTYGDLHRRGLRLIGLPWPGEVPDAPAEVAGWVRTRAVRAVAGLPTRPGPLHLLAGR